MTRPKKVSRVLTKSESRLLGIKTIDAKLDLGSGLSTTAFEKQIAGLRQQINDYNAMLTVADAASNKIIEAEKALASTAERMLTGVATRYGRTSDEYEMAGGSKRGDRPRRKPSQPPVETSPQAATV